MDKIYSRRRIKIPKMKLKKCDKVKCIFSFVLLIFNFACISFIIASYPIFVASCKTAAGSKANNIVSEEVKNVMNDYSYSDLIDIEKDVDGNVTLMKSNTILINKINSQIVSNIQREIDNTPRVMVYINYGSVSGISFLKVFGPKFEIELEAAGNINTKMKSEFESVNVNQTIHKIYMDLDMSISVLTPIGVYGKDVESKVLLTEAVIVGKVPETYYNLENLQREDSLEIIE